MSQWDQRPGQTAAEDISLLAGEVVQAATRLAPQFPNRVSADTHIGGPKLPKAHHPGNSA